MTKVCHMTSAHGPEDMRIFHKECVSLAKAGYETYLVQRGGSYEKNSVHIVGLGQPPTGRLKRMTAFARQAYEAALALNADIYHLHDPELLPYGLKLKKKGKKVIFDSHEYYRIQMRDKPYLPKWASRFAAWCYTRLEDYVLRRIDGLILPCEMDGENPFTGKCAHVAPVNNVPLLEELYDCYDPAVPKWERSVCYMGGLTYNRGITYLVKAAAKAGCTAYLGGAFVPASYQGELEALPEYRHVRYLGQLSRQQVLEALQSCQIGIATLLHVNQYSKAGNLATKVYEYMSLGLPVILSDSAYNRKVTDRLHFGLCVDPESPDEIAAAICYLLDHPEEARQMGENGRKAVREEFNWTVEEKTLLRLYEEILNA